MLSLAMGENELKQTLDGALARRYITSAARWSVPRSVRPSRVLIVIGVQLAEVALLAVIQFKVPHQTLQVHQVMRLGLPIIFSDRLLLEAQLEGYLNRETPAEVYRSPGAAVVCENLRSADVVPRALFVDGFVPTRGS